MNWEIIKNSIYKKYSKNAGKIILHAGLVTWTTASLAHVVAIIYNDKIPQDQKKFLIPQEIADGALNIAAFYIITKSMKDIAGKFVSTGKWSNESIRTFIGKQAKRINMGDFDLNLVEKFKGENELVKGEFHKAYDPFKNGIDMISTSLGTVISCNAITPFIRNSYGAKQQKLSLEKEKKKTVQNAFRPESLSKLNGNKLKI